MNFCSTALSKAAALSQSAVEGAQNAIAAKSEEATVALLQDLKIFDKILKKANCLIEKVTMSVGVPPSLTVSVVRQLDADLQFLAAASEDMQYSMTVRMGLQLVVQAGRMDAFCANNGVRQTGISVTLSPMPTACALDIDLHIED